MNAILSIRVLELEAHVADLEALLLSRKIGLHPADERGPCLCSQCEFTRKSDELIGRNMLKPSILKP